MTVEMTCAPLCAPNTAAQLPTPAPGPTPNVLPPFDVDRETCSGIVVEQATQTVAAVILPGTVVYTKKCPGDTEFDHTILCDPSGAKVIVVVSYAATGIPTTAFYTLAGADYTGDTSLLTACDTDLESDPLLWCDGGQDVIQWVVKSNGSPTGATFWTDAAGLIIAAPTAATRGACLTACALPARGIQPSW